MTLGQITAMPLPYVVEVGLRSVPDAVERPGLSTLHGLSVLRESMDQDRMSGFFEKVRSYRRAFEAMADASGATGDLYRQMAGTFGEADTVPRAEPILAALSEAGLARQASAFRAAMGIALDDRPDFAPFDAAFGPTEAFDAGVAAYVARTPMLTAWVIQARSDLDDDTRLDWLLTQLSLLDDTEWASLSAALGTIHLLHDFTAHAVRGGLSQAFFNTPGDLAPEVAAGLRLLGLTAQAVAVERGIALFHSSYPRDTGARREAYVGGGAAYWNAGLAALDEGLDLDAVRPALIALAKSEGTLPK